MRIDDINPTAYMVSIVCRECRRHIFQEFRAARSGYLVFDCPYCGKIERMEIKKPLDDVYENKLRDDDFNPALEE